MKLLSGLKTLEQQKHLKPMFSTYCTDLADFIKNNKDYVMEQSIQDVQNCSQINSELDFQILNDGLAYDDTRLHRFTPSRLETVLEKPRSRGFSREKTQKHIYVRNTPIEAGTVKFHPCIKKKKKHINSSGIYQNRAFAKIDHDMSY